MRAIIGASLRFRVLVVAVAAAVIVARLHAAARRAGRRPARVHAAVRRGPDRGARAVRRGGGAARHRPARGRPPQRDAGRQRPALGVGRRAVVDRPALRAGHRPHGRASARAGAAHPGAREPERLQAAADAPAALLAEPGHDDRAVARRGSSRSRPRCSPAGRSARACWASPAWRTCRCSACATASCRCSSTRSGCATSA